MPRATVPDLRDAVVDLNSQRAVERIAHGSLQQKLDADLGMPVGAYDGLDGWIAADLPRSLSLRTLVETLRGDGRKDLLGAMTALMDQNRNARGQFPELRTIPDTVAHQRLNRIVARAAVRQFGQSAANSSGDTS